MVKHSYCDAENKIPFASIGLVKKHESNVVVYITGVSGYVLLQDSEMIDFLIQYNDWKVEQLELARANLDSLLATAALQKLMIEEMQQRAVDRTTLTQEGARGLQQMVTANPSIEIRIIVDAPTYEEACEKAEAISFREMPEYTAFEVDFYWYASDSSSPDQLNIRRFKDE
jgi:hypothetical protein